ncbi:MAG TPA: inositol monophosphatase [Opitutaceae bacterium]|nr:inositol monophosphatase [Opitutaceae bacterium]
MTNAQLNRLRRLLCELQDHIRHILLGARRRTGGQWSRVAGSTAADTIYAVDRISEGAILEWFERHWPRAWPVELVMEGIEEGEVVTIPRGVPASRTRFKCILDPIDGTRGLMYDKRSAWILAGVADQRGARTNVRDIIVAAMTELPTSRHACADQFSAVRGGGVVATTCELQTGRKTRRRTLPSTAKDFRHGFVSFARFFTAGKTMISQIEEAVWADLHGPADVQLPLVFDDQYISTGGQLAELLVGHDRMVADVRPLVFAKLGIRAGLVCHPYDICTELILREAGGIVEAPTGGPVRVPLDTTTPVAWVGYANSTLARLARPAMRQALKRFL